MIEAKKVFQDAFFDFGTLLRQRVVGGGLAGAGVGEDGGPVFLPVALGVGGGVGGEDGAVEFFVGDFESGGSLVVEVGEGAFLEAGILGGEGHDGGLADEGTGIGRDVLELVGGVDAVGDGLEPFGGIDLAASL